ncbi:MAG: pyridoxal-phosphate dependent enzyme [Planctomycetota bacterium]
MHAAEVIHKGACEAAKRIEPHVARTPLVDCELLATTTGIGQVLLKCENLQHGGAFKSRGACNAVFSLADDAAKRGVLTHSSGNHAAAIARAAKRRGVEAHVVMPRNSSPAKVANVRRYGVEPLFCGPTAEERQAAADAIADETGATLIHPYNQHEVICGQGTVGLEVLDQCDDLDAVIVPVGGGGLLAGVLSVVKKSRPDIKVIAAEPAWADDASRSLAAGSIQQPTRYDTVADGLRTPLGDRTFPILRELLDDLVLVTEDQILDAQQRLAVDAWLVVEPSGAVGVAALEQLAPQFADRRIAIILTGGNVVLPTRH